MNNHQECVAILDAGSQYGKVIDRRIRELNIKSIFLPLNTSADTIKSKYPNVKGIFIYTKKKKSKNTAPTPSTTALVISGGPESVYAPNAPKYDEGIFSLGIPILGICYGMQMLAAFSEGGVERKDEREDGQFFVTVFLFLSFPSSFY